MDESTLDDPSAPGPQGLDFDATSASVLGGLFGEAERPRVGRYAVLRPLGSGAMGRVFAARDTSLQRDVALKLLHVERGGDAKARARFLREARALGRVSHPNVVEVFEVGVHGGDVFIAMELLRGQTLRAWMHAEPRTWGQTLEVLLQLGAGLAAAHAAELVHRDVKPANAWVGEDGRARVIDFGLAMADANDLSETDSSASRLREALEVASSKLTRTGAIVGSPAYMAPEQLMHRSATEASDQFSFCVTAFEALHGRRPFEGFTPLQLLDAIQRGSIVRTDDDTPRWIDRILARGLEAQASDRWASMEALVAALRRGPSRRWVGLGGVSLIGAGLAGALAWPSSTTQGCMRHDLPSWDAEVRRSLKSRVAATDVAFERDIAGPLDAWSDAWSARHRETCEAGSDAEGFDRTLHCLDVARERFGDTVAVLDGLEPGRVGEAVAVAAGVSKIPTCTEARSEASDRALRALSRIAALDRAGRYEEAIAAAKEALVYAEDPRARAELLQVAASAALHSERGADAVSLGEQAYFLALREGLDGLAVEAVIVIVAALGRDGELEAAQRWYETGVAMVENTEDPTASRGELEESLGLALFTAGRPEEAVARYDAAIDALPADRPTRLATLQGDRGNALLDAGRFEEGRAALARSLDAMKAAYGPDHAMVGIGHTNLGSAFAMSGEYAEARPHFVEALRISRLLNDPKALGLALGSMGLIEQATGNYDEARPYLEQSLEAFESIGEPSSPRVLAGLHNLALNAQARGDLEDAERQLWALLERKRAKLGPDHVSLGSTYDALGNNYVQRDRFEDAQPNFREALRILEGALGSEHPDLVFPLLGLGQCAAALGLQDEAIRQFRRALRLSEQDGVDPELLHDARIGLAKALRAAGGRDDEARRLLAKARASAVEREDAAALEAVEAAG